MYIFLLFEFALGGKQLSENIAYIHIQCSYKNVYKNQMKLHQNQLHNYMTVPNNVVQESSSGSLASVLMP